MSNDPLTKINKEVISKRRKTRRSTGLDYSSTDRRQLDKQGVVAEVGATLLNDAGTQVAEDFSARCIAITTDQLRRVGRVVLVAGGQRKARAALAAAKTGFVAEMITDRALAEAILNDHENPG